MVKWEPVAMCPDLNHVTVEGFCDGCSAPLQLQMVAEEDYLFSKKEKKTLPPMPKHFIFQSHVYLKHSTYHHQLK